MEAIVLCGGLGTRLRSVYPDRAKALASIGDRYFLDILLEWLKEQGITRVILAVGHLADQIVDHVNTHPISGLEIAFSVESAPMGTGGALALAAQQAQEDRVLALNGDSLCPINIKSFYEAHITAPETPIIAATKVPHAGAYGVIDANEDGAVTGFHTQDADDPAPGLVNSGLYWIPKACLEALPSGKAMSLENNIFPQWIAKSHGLRVHAHDTPFQDIGTPERLKDAETFLRSIR